MIMTRIKLIGISAPLLAVSIAFVGCNNEQPTTLLPQPGSYTPPNGVVGDPAGTDDAPAGTDNGLGDGKYNGDEENTFSHEDDLSQDGSKDPFEVLEQRLEEGPLQIRTRLHSCNKLQNQALRSLLVALGVDIEASGNPDPAGELFRNGRDALGGANYASRTGEALTWTNSGATKLQDILVQAAPEIIAALPNVAHCQIDGVGPAMFDDNDQCNPDAVTCLIGVPASAEHLAICNHIVQSASDVEKGKAIAVGSLLAGAYTCM
jgi:hypothetical protein